VNKLLRVKNLEKIKCDENFENVGGTFLSILTKIYSKHNNICG
jgi:hypothetical protein